jgi:hypothetical protein
MLASLAACTDRLPTDRGNAVQQQRTPTIALESAITSQLASSLSAGGELPIPIDNQSDTEISADFATQLATACVRTFGPFNRDVFEKVTGFAIRFDELVPGSRVFLSHTPFEDISNRYIRAYAKALGSYYLITFSQAGSPAVSVAVSARASDLRLIDGRIVFPLEYGNEFVMLAIPRGIEYPITPERAVRLASESSGRLVTESPVLVAKVADRFAPQYSNWRVILNAPLQVQAAGEPPVFADTVYVDWRGNLATRSTRDDIPDSMRLNIAGSPGVSELVQLSGRPGYARHVVVASVSGRSQ